MYRNDTSLTKARLGSVAVLSPVPCVVGKRLSPSIYRRSIEAPTEHGALSLSEYTSDDALTFSYRHHPESLPLSTPGILQLDVVDANPCAFKTPLATRLVSLTNLFSVLQARSTKAGSVTAVWSPQDAPLISCPPGGHCTSRPDLPRRSDHSAPSCSTFACCALFHEPAAGKDTKYGRGPGFVCGVTTFAGRR